MATAKTVQLVSFDRGGKLLLDQKALQSLFLRDDVRDRQVAIVSVAGAFRQGKSFLMDFLIDFLKKKGEVRWLENGDAKIEGFEWRSSRKRVTQGINVWSQYFLVNEVAVFLMDTQGTMDTQSSKDESTIVFALSALLSSTQIYNVMDIMGSQDLFNVEYFAEYGRLALQDAGQGVRPFQKFLFLVRDWKHTKDHAFGLQGGREYLDSFVNSTNAQKRKMYESVHSTLNLCFNETLCFLMPYPGEQVARAKEFKGELKDVSPEFLEQVAILADLLLSPEGLPPKQVCGRTVTAEELVPFFTKHAEIFNSGKLPKPKSLLDVLAFDVLLRLVDRCKTTYDSQMQAGLAVQGADLTRVNEGAVRITLEEFSRASKVGTEIDVEEHRQQLQNYMFEQLEFHKEMSSVREELAAKKAELEHQAQIQRQIKENISQLQREGSRIDQECQEATKNRKKLEMKLQDIKRQELTQKMELIRKESSLKTKQQEMARNLSTQCEEKKRAVEQKKEKIRNLKKMIEENNANGFIAGLKDLGQGYVESAKDLVEKFGLE